VQQLNVLIFVSLCYVIALFLIAFAAERAARQGRAGWLRSPWVYTLSLSIYCTGWTFYGAVGFAVRSGLEFVTIYLGPSLVMLGWWWIVRKLVRIGRTQRITSIADLVSSRFGKSNLLASGVTILAVVGTTPYIALQLQSVTQSFGVFAEASGQVQTSAAQGTTAFWVAAGLAFFTILFGTRNLDVNERHDGVVMAIAVEAVVKLFALLAVGAFVVWGVAGGLGPMMAQMADRPAQSGTEYAGDPVVSGRAQLCHVHGDCRLDCGLHDGVQPYRHARLDQKHGRRRLGVGRCALCGAACAASVHCGHCDACVFLFSPVGRRLGACGDWSCVIRGRGAWIRSCIA